MAAYDSHFQKIVIEVTDARHKYIRYSFLLYLGCHCRFLRVQERAFGEVGGRQKGEEGGEGGREKGEREVRKKGRERERREKVLQPSLDITLGAKGE